jgi:hypothetical protein
MSLWTRSVGGERADGLAARSTPLEFGRSDAQSLITKELVSLSTPRSQQLAAFLPDFPDLFNTDELRARFVEPIKQRVDKRDRACAPRPSGVRPGRTVVLNDGKQDFGSKAWGELRYASSRIATVALDCTGAGAGLLPLPLLVLPLLVLRQSESCPGDGSTVKTAVCRASTPSRRCMLQGGSGAARDRRDSRLGPSRPQSVEALHAAGLGAAPLETVETRGSDRRDRTASRRCMLQGWERRSSRPSRLEARTVETENVDSVEALHAAGLSAAQLETVETRVSDRRDRTAWRCNAAGHGSGAGRAGRAGRAGCGSRRSQAQALDTQLSQL